MFFIAHLYNTKVHYQFTVSGSFPCYEVYKLTQVNI